jgi:hypothetical protein
MTAKIPVTAFDKGQAAVRSGDTGPNPFPEGSVEHNNYEVGMRFGLQRRRDGGSVLQSLVSGDAA